MPIIPLQLFVLSGKRREVSQVSPMNHQSRVICTGLIGTGQGPSNHKKFATVSMNRRC